MSDADRSLAKDLSKRHVKATVQRTAVQKHLQEFENNNLKKHEIAEMEETERAFLRDVVDMAKHDTLENPYEVSVDRGEWRIAKPVSLCSQDA